MSSCLFKQVEFVQNNLYVKFDLDSKRFKCACFLFLFAVPHAHSLACNSYAFLALENDGQGEPRWACEILQSWNPRLCCEAAHHTVYTVWVCLGYLELLVEIVRGGVEATENGLAKCQELKVNKLNAGFLLASLPLPPLPLGSTLVWTH